MASASLILNGQIVWETTRVSQNVEPSAEVVTAVFPFVNGGDSPLTILEMRASCGCTTPELDKKIYQPGESGQITDFFYVGNRQGKQVKSIRVTTDAAEEPTVLKMETLIPEMIALEPNYLFWQIGKQPEPKSVEVNIVLDHPIHITSVESSDSRVGVELEELEAGKRYRIRATPTQTESRMRSTIRLSTDFPQENPKVFKIYARVK